MSVVQVSANIGPGNHFVPVSDIPELVSAEAALDYFRHTKLAGGITCPRCTSKYIKVVNTAIFAELFRCVDCQYMFNSLSGSILKNIKIPVVKYLQSIVIYDCSEVEEVKRNITFALGVTLKSSVLIVNKISRKPIRANYISRDYNFYANHSDQALSEDHRQFVLFCRMYNIGIDRELFLKRVAEVLLDKSE